MPLPVSRGAKTPHLPQTLSAAVLPTSHRRTLRTTPPGRMAAPGCSKVAAHSAVFYNRRAREQPHAGVHHALTFVQLANRQPPTANRHPVRIPSMMRASVLVAFATIGVAAAGIYPDGHFDKVTKLTNDVSRRITGFGRAMQRPPPRPPLFMTATLRAQTHTRAVAYPRGGWLIGQHRRLALGSRTRRRAAWPCLCRTRARAAPTPTLLRGTAAQYPADTFAAPPQTPFPALSAPPLSCACVLSRLLSLFPFSHAHAHCPCVPLPFCSLFCTPPSLFMAEQNFDSTVADAVASDKTLFVRWIASEG